MAVSVKNAPVSRYQNGARPVSHMTLQGGLQFCAVTAAFTFVAVVVLAI